MAAPSYTEDLTDIDLAESASTGWTAFNISGGGGGAPAFGADLVLQGLGCWDKAASNAERGLAVNKTPGAGTVAAGVHIFVWGFCATPGITDTLQNRGAYVIIGTSTTNFMQFHVEGKFTYGAGGRVGKCYIVDYVTTSNTGSIPYRTVNGTPGATPTYFGFGLKTTATAKGSNIGCDAIRYGTGAYITAGDSGDPATFLGFQTENDDIDNRWGILTDVGGSYELQGRFVVGQNNSKVATQAYFDDSSGITILVVDTVHSASDFSQIIVDHASTVFNLTGATIKSLGTNNPGALIFNNDSTTSALSSNTFDSIGVTTLRGGVTATENLWKKCGLITQNGATITGGTIRESSAPSALLVDTALEMADITDVSFIDNNKGGTPIVDTATYFDGSDVAATDSGSDWVNVTNSDDGSTATVSTSAGNVISTITIEGTDYTLTSGYNLLSVRVRIHGHATASTSAIITASVYEDGGSNLLGAVSIIDSGSTTNAYSEYATLTPPSGGWTEANIQALEVQITGSTSGAISPSIGVTKVELEITESQGHSIELTATGTHSFGSITFEGGGGTQGSNLVASSGYLIADVYNNSGGAITINVTGGGTTPSVRNAASSTTTVNATVNVTLTGLQDNTEVRVMQAGSNTVELAGTESATTGTPGNRSFTFSLSASTTVDIYIVNVIYENVEIEGYTVPSTASSIPIQQRFDRSYLNP